jgi:hypothetical protein
MKSKEPATDLLELAWGIIANAGGGNWERESKEWQDAAVKWRDAYHGSLPQQPPATDWTPERVRKLLQESNHGCPVITDELCKIVSKTITAALAAEREKVRRCEVIHRHSETIELLKQQLDAALATIAEATTLLQRRHNEPDKTIKLLQKADLVVLKCHDAEVRKPLVDALERLRERFKRYNGLPIGSDDVKIINDALAKAKP